MASLRKNIVVTPEEVRQLSEIRRMISSKISDSAIIRDLIQEEYEWLMEQETHGGMRSEV